MTAKTGGPTPGELRGNEAGKLRGGGPEGLYGSTKLNQEPCRPGSFEEACEKIANPGLDGIEGVYQDQEKD